MRTLTVVVAGSRDPTSLLTAPGVPMRVVIRNVSGGGSINISYDVNDLAPTSSSEVFSLPFNNEDVFILAPGQKLYAVGVGAGPFTLSLACSEAFPTV
jgi:hypothetical protein